MNPDYKEIRPYTDQEASRALKRVADAPELSAVSAFLYGPGPEKEAALRDVMRSLDTIDEFQAKVMAGVIRSILHKTSSSLEVSGLEYVEDGRKHVLMSNHRDIILDPAIMQLIFFEHKVSTTEIAVGDNLIANSFIEDVFRSNRMIKVVRGGNPREKYMASALLSSYMRDNISSGRCSVWIAQKGGRSKDGRDITSQGVLKMLDMSGEKDFVQNFLEISILPFAISYQYEPCDFLKAREVYITRRGEYVKRPGEDTHSILTGVTQEKGGIAFHFCPALTEADIASCAAKGKNDRMKALAAMIDDRICSSYRLWDTNFIAYDLLEGSQGNAGSYTEEARQVFVRRMEKGLSAIVEKDPDIDRSELREIFLAIYSNPVRSVREHPVAGKESSCPA